MAIFEEVRLEWNGTQFVIPPTEVMRVIAKVEDILTLQELARQVAAREFKFSRIAQAYSVLLRHAGAKVTDEEVYAAIFPKGGNDVLLRATAALQTLMTLMVPPDTFKAEGGQSGKP